MDVVDELDVILQDGAWVVVPNDTLSPLVAAGDLVRMRVYRREVLRDGKIVLARVADDVVLRQYRRLAGSVFELYGPSPDIAVVRSPEFDIKILAYADKRMLDA